MSDLFPFLYSTYDPDLNNEEDLAYVGVFREIAAKYDGERPIFKLLDSDFPKANTTLSENNKPQIAISTSAPIEHADAMIAHEFGHVKNGDIYRVSPTWLKSDFGNSQHASAIYGLILACAAVLIAVAFTNCTRLGKKIKDSFRGFGYPSLLAGGFATFFYAESAHRNSDMPTRADYSDRSVKMEMAADAFAAEIIDPEESLKAAIWTKNYVEKKRTELGITEDTTYPTHPAIDDRIKFFQMKVDERRQRVAASELQK